MTDTRLIDTAALQICRLFLRNWPRRIGRGRVYALGQRAARRIGGMPVRTRDGVLMICDGVERMQRSILLLGIWEPPLTRLVKRMLRPGDVFVDVGANVGYFTLLAARIVGASGRCVSIEAAPDTAERLRRNVALNGFENVRVVESAVADRRGSMTFYVAHEHKIGASTLVEARGRKKGYRPTEVQVAPLTELLSEEDMRSARFIKIDVEGAESAVLEPIFGALDRFSPDVVFVIEFAPGTLRLNGTSLREQIERFRAAGFAAYFLELDHPTYNYVHHDGRTLADPIPVDSLSEAEFEAVAARPHVDVALSRRALD